MALLPREPRPISVRQSREKYRPNEVTMVVGVAALRNPPENCAPPLDGPEPNEAMTAKQMRVIYCPFQLPSAARNEPEPAADWSWPRLRVSLALLGPAWLGRHLAWPARPVRLYVRGQMSVACALAERQATRALLCSLRLQLRLSRSIACSQVDGQSRSGAGLKCLYVFVS